MGKIVINQTDEKQTVILTNDAEGITGVYFGEDGEEKPVGIGADAIATGAAPSGDIVLSEDVTHIIDYAFAGSAITSLTAPEVTSFGTQIVRGCKQLKKVEAPKLEGVTELTQDDAAHQLDSLDTLKFYGATVVYPQSVQGYPALKKIAIPSVTTVQANGFKLGNITNLEVIDLGPNFKTIGSYFYNRSSSALQDIVLRSSTVVNKSVTNTGLESLTINYYVPSDLISSYQSATRWSDLYSDGKAVFKALEGSVYENAYADGTPIE